MPMPDDPTTDEIAKEVNGYALEDLPDPTDPTKSPILKAGSSSTASRSCRDDGKTACGCWIYSRLATPRRATRWPAATTPTRTNSGLPPDWAWSWPANRRILYNRASADATASRGQPASKLIEWNGARWAGVDVPDYGDRAAGRVAGPFIMNPEGVARLFTRGMMRDGPFPEHYEPFEAPVDNALHPKVGPIRWRASSRATWRCSASRTTSRIVGHHLSPDRAFPLLEQARPDQCHPAAAAVRRDRRRAWPRRRESRTAIWSRCAATAARSRPVAVVTKRIKPLTIDGKTVHTVGIPIHWGFTGATKKGFGANIADALCR